MSLINDILGDKIWFINKTFWLSLWNLERVITKTEKGAFIREGHLLGEITESYHWQLILLGNIFLKS